MLRRPLLVQSLTNFGSGPSEQYARITSGDSCRSSTRTDKATRTHLGMISLRNCNSAMGQRDLFWPGSSRERRVQLQVTCPRGTNERTSSLFYNYSVLMPTVSDGDVVRERSVCVRPRSVRSPLPLVGARARHPPLSPDAMPTMAVALAAAVIIAHRSCRGECGGRGCCSSWCRQRPLTQSRSLPGSPLPPALQPGSVPCWRK